MPTTGLSVIWLGSSVAEAPQHLAALRQARSGADAATLGRVAHAFKSSSFNVGAQGLGELCRQLERLSKAQDLAACGPLVDAIAQHFQSVRPLLTAELGQAA